MTVTEQLGSLGSWSVTLSDDTPRAVTDQLGFFGHIGIWSGRVDVDQASDAALLAAARYVGVLREKPTGRTSLEGAGLLFWLGDEDGKGAVLEQPVTFTAASLTACVARLLPPAVTLGTVHDPGGTYTGTHQWQTPRAVLDTITAFFGVEYRVNPTGTVDVGTPAQLYPAGSQAAVISARDAGRDFNLASLGADFQTDTAVIDYTSRVVLLGQQTDSAGNSTPFVEATADALLFPYKDLRGNPVHITRAVSDQGQTDASAPAAAQLQLNQYNRTKTALTVTTSDYDMSGQPLVGQMAYVFDPDNGLVDPATQLDFRGELIYPQLIRISGLQWPLTSGMTVAFRTQDGTWIDLTRWVLWESQAEQVTVGDLPRTLTSGGNPVLSQTQAAPDASVPSAPTGLQLTTTSYESSIGQSTATVTASWTAPALNADGSVVTDLSHYLVQYRWHGRAPLWTTLIAPTASIDIPGLSVGLVYDVQVAAVDTTGHTSAYTPVAQITAAPDQTAPNPPSDPVVSSYLGQLRIAWDGKTSTGSAMPPDFAIVEVHVSASSGFTPVAGPGSTTLVDQLSTAGVSYATAPYGSPRYVKLVAVDNSGNRSAPSNQVAGSTVQAGDGDIAALSVGKLTAGTMSADVVVSGRFATALTGGRVEMNALGFQKFASDGVTKLISLTGAEALLTGTYKTALTGRRMEIGSAGTTGEVDFYAPDGTKSLLRAFTESNGIESIQFGVPITANASASQDILWNRWHANSDEWAQVRGNRVDLMFGTHRTAATPSAPGYFIVRSSPDRGQTAVARLFVDQTTFQVGNSTGTIQFQINDTSMVYALAGVNRLSVDAAGFAYWDPSGRNRLYVNNNVVGIFNTQAQTFFIDFNPAGNLTILPGLVPGDTARAQFINQGGYAAIWKMYYVASDVGGLRFEARDANDSTYVPIWASGFTVNSDRSGKHDVEDYPGSAVAALRGIRLRKYQRDPVHGPDGTTLTRPVEVGLVADEVPTDLVVGDPGGQGVDVNALAAMAAAGIRELDARLALLERPVKK